MPTEHDYSLQDLADLAGVTPRTVRYYIGQGLLPAPGRVGPGTTYGDGHLARLRLIRRLVREHLPLAEVRTRLGGLDDNAVAALVELPATEPHPGSAVDYIRGLLSRADGPGPLAQLAPLGPAMLHDPKPAEAAAPPGPERSQWDRLVLTPDLELHIRRPLTRQQNKRVDRLIAIARQLLEEDQP